MAVAAGRSRGRHPGVLHGSARTPMVRSLRARQGAVPHVRARLRGSTDAECAAGGFEAEAGRRRRNAQHRLRRRGAGAGERIGGTRGRGLLQARVRPRAVRSRRPRAARGLPRARARAPVADLRTLRSRRAAGPELRGPRRGVPDDVRAGHRAAGAGAAGLQGAHCRGAEVSLRQRRGIPPRGPRAPGAGGRVIWLPDATVDHLIAVAGWPEFTSDRYEVIEEIGRGGMGTVYSARDHALGREVAIKIGNALPSAELQARLTSEAKVLARLEHPGIVPVHDFGILADGRPFYVMKRVQGRTLQACIEAGLPLADRLRIFERICEAVG